MSELATILFVSWLAGIAAFIGGITSRIEQTAESSNKDELIHGIVAFGGGVLLSAVSFSLAPKAMDELTPLILAFTFLGGGIVFSYLDAFLSKRGGSKAQLVAMIMDFFPEALALGALFVSDKHAAILLAVFIGAQNLPEGFNSYREIIDGKVKSSKALLVLFLISFLGPAAAATGYFMLHDYPGVTAGIMSFSAGGILYLIFQDIAPKSTLKRHWTPPLGAVLGFLFGMVCEQMLG